MEMLKGGFHPAARIVPLTFYGAAAIPFVSEPELFRLSIGVLTREIIAIFEIHPLRNRMNYC